MNPENTEEIEFLKYVVTGLVANPDDIQIEKKDDEL